jgi:hypothetical protein
MPVWKVAQLEDGSSAEFGIFGHFLFGGVLVLK